MIRHNPESHSIISFTRSHAHSNTVKYAVDAETKKTYAVKVMNLNSIRREKMEIQLRREIAIMKILKHRYIVELKEVLQTDRNIYIVMELVTGGELFDKIVAEKKFSESVARRYFQQLIIAIQYCHSHGIAHRGMCVCVPVCRVSPCFVAFCFVLWLQLELSALTHHHHHHSTHCNTHH